MIRRTVPVILRGNYKGKDGVFEFIKEQNGEINHRYFRPY